MNKQTLTSTDAATPRPWRKLPSLIVTAHDMSICDFNVSSINNQPAKEANADLIVKAVNEYDSLKSELCKERTENIVLKQMLAAHEAVLDAANKVIVTPMMGFAHTEAADKMVEALDQLAKLKKELK